MKTIIQLLSPILVGLIFAVNISTASAASCKVKDVSVNLIGGGTADANACRDNTGNDSPSYQDDINSDFMLGSTLTWSFAEKVDADTDLYDAMFGVSGEWTFLSTMSNPFVIVVKNKGFAAYLFNVDSTGVINWSTLGLDNKDISHLTLYTSTGGPGEVPLPAAIWLFGSALMGLVGVRKRYTA